MLRFFFFNEDSSQIFQKNSSSTAKKKKEWYLSISVWMLNLFEFFRLNDLIWMFHSLNETEKTERRRKKCFFCHCYCRLLFLGMCALPSRDSRQPRSRDSVCAPLGKRIGHLNISNRQTAEASRRSFPHSWLQLSFGSVWILSLDDYWLNVAGAHVIACRYNWFHFFCCLLGFDPTDLIDFEIVRLGLHESNCLVSIIDNSLAITEWRSDPDSRLTFQLEFVDCDCVFFFSSKLLIGHADGDLNSNGNIGIDLDLMAAATLPATSKVGLG